MLSFVPVLHHAIFQELTQVVIRATSDAKETFGWTVLLQQPSYLPLLALDIMKRNEGDSAALKA